MPQTASQSPLSDNRLIRLLGSLNLAETKVVAPPITERLAQLIDLPGSIRISDTHGRMSKLGFEAAPVSLRMVQELFLHAQTAMVDFIVKSFSPEHVVPRIKPPVAAQLAPEDQVAACEPYLKFYAAHQRQLELKIQTLQLQVRESISGLSPQLAQLSTLDTVLGDTLASYSRKAFAVVPTLLSQRFTQLFDEHVAALNNPDEKPTSWPQCVDGYLGEMRAILLAETEARLLPILGLIETIKENSDSNDYK